VVTAVPSIEELESRMRSGAFSRAGFLGPDEKLEDVLEADAHTLGELALSHERLAEALDHLIAAAEASPARRATVDGRYLVAVELRPGFQICPWAPDPHHAQCTAGQGVRHASMDWQIRNLRTRASMRGPGLAVHLIRDHHFFEGRESPFRLDPPALAQLLELH
jgi:hypothetical protein